MIAATTTGNQITNNENAAAAAAAAAHKATNNSNNKRPLASRRESSMKKNEHRVLLGENYIPGDNAVICGRGKSCTQSPGNIKLKHIVDSLGKAYELASNKEEKSLIVSRVISVIEEADGGAFVKFEEDTWWRVDDTYAREKVTYMFRDILHMKYRSSSKAKAARKMNKSSGATKLAVAVAGLSPKTVGSTTLNRMPKRVSMDNVKPSGMFFPRMEVDRSAWCSMSTPDQIHSFSVPSTMQEFHRRNSMISCGSQTIFAREAMMDGSISSTATASTIVTNMGSVASAHDDDVDDDDDYPTDEVETSRSRLLDMCQQALNITGCHHHSSNHNMSSHLVPSMDVSTTTTTTSSSSSPRSVTFVNNDRKEPNTIDHQDLFLNLFREENKNDDDYDDGNDHDDSHSIATFTDENIFSDFAEEDEKELSLGDELSDIFD